jgi:quinol monooxygenase YgiN
LQTKIDAPHESKVTKTLYLASRQTALLTQIPVGLTIASSNGMFQVSLRMMSRPSRSLEVIEALRSIRTAAKMDRGFLEGRIYQEAGNPEALCFEQDWSSELELKSHIRSSCFTDLLRLMETSPAAPILEIHSVNNVFDMRYVEGVRFSDD